MSRLLAATPVAAVEPVAQLHRLQADGGDAPARLVPGMRLFMHVIEPLLHGGVRAREENGGAEHRLPFDARPGARLHVLVAGTDARPTFLLLQDDAGAPGSSFSHAARVLAALTQGKELATRPPVVQAATPLVPGPVVDASALRLAVANALSGSGLFYEAHLAQWVAGTRTREALLNEPQARLTLREVAASRDPARADANMAPRGAEARAPAHELHGVLHRNTVTLVQQQLAALETGAIVWRGEAWRGQTLEWTVQRDSGAHDTDVGEDGYGHWRTRLCLTLPQLGTVDATLGIDARGLEVRITAADPGAANALRGASGALAAALAQAGLNIRRLEVRHGP